MFPQVQTVIETAADEFGITMDDLVTQGVRQFLERQLRDVQIEIFQITNAYGVRTVQELESLYLTDDLEEETSWRDAQRLDHLEYKQDRLKSLLDTLP